MKKLQAGLVIEGNSTSSTLLRLSRVAAELGPIKSSGLQVARRVSNFLRAGYAVSSYADLKSARTVLIRVPDASVERVVAEIRDADLDLREHSFVLCETWSPTERLEPLKSRGASIASLVAMPTGREKTFAIEGDALAVRQIRRIIKGTDTRTIEVRPGTKHLLFAGTVLCAAVPVPVLLMAQQMLRDSGVTGNQLSAVIEAMSAEMLAGFLKGARVTWGGALADSLKSFQGDYWERLSNTHPELAHSLKDLVNLSRAYMLPKMSRSHQA
jgi:predicted short-subunit dehydrogenase-like oxidoreductase (DUF2520 family)